MIEFVQNLPEHWLIDTDGRKKTIFRDAVADIAPEPALARRDKIGFATPENRWFGESQDIVDALLNAAADLEIPFLDIKAARK